jgi:hypothetical protein
MCRESLEKTNIAETQKEGGLMQRMIKFDKISHIKNPVVDIGSKSF